MPAGIKYATYLPSDIILDSEPFKSKRKTRSRYPVYSITQRETPSFDYVGQVPGRKHCESLVQRTFGG
jgi:hypothetical protein